MKYGKFELEILSESGHEEALIGMSLSFFREGTDFLLWWKEQRPKALIRASKLAKKGGGHNKFLASINVQLLVKASRAFWSEFDTYQFLTKNSASTMHTLAKEPVNKSHFIGGTSQVLLDNLNQLIEQKANINIIKANLPEGYLQTRQVSVNYMSLKNIIAQREKHRLTQWQDFCSQLLNQLDKPEYIYETPTK